jgi:hypothetical protein
MHLVLLFFGEELRARTLPEKIVSVGWKRESEILLKKYATIFA